jgi:hypothetical protein
MVYAEALNVIGPTVPEGRSFVIHRFGTPGGKISESPGAGMAAGDQFPAADQLPLSAPVHVRVIADEGRAMRDRTMPAARAYDLRRTSTPYGRSWTEASARLKGLMDRDGYNALLDWRPQLFAVAQ